MFHYSEFFSFKVSDLFLLSLQPQCHSGNVIIKLSCYLYATRRELFIVSQTTAISLNCLTVVKKSFVKLCTQDILALPFFFSTDPSRSSPKERLKP